MRKMLGVGGVLLAVVGVVAAGRLRSQEKVPPARPETRIGLINLTYVISNYDKYKAYKDEIKADAKPYEERIKQLQEQVETLKKDYDRIDPLLPKRDDIEKAIKQAQADIQKQNEEAKKALGEKNAKQMILTYKEVRSVCEGYAKSHDLEMVLQYNAPINLDDIDSAPDVQRKMGAGALIPLYMAPGLDVSEDVLALLNKSK